MITLIPGIEHASPAPAFFFPPDRNCSTVDQTSLFSDPLSAGASPYPGQEEIPELRPVPREAPNLAPTRPQSRSPTTDPRARPGPPGRGQTSICSLAFRIQVVPPGHPVRSPASFDRHAQLPFPKLQIEV
jgi:hypothetical protein